MSARTLQLPTDVARGLEPTTRAGADRPGGTTAAVETARRPRQAHDRTRPLVLVIEGQPDLRLSLRHLLGRAGFAIAEAADGRTGLRAQHDERPDLVLLDLGISVLDGLDVLERIRDVSDVPVLLLAGSASADEKVRALQCGADDCVTKPFGPHELVARVHALLRRSPSERPTVAAERFDDGWLTVDFTARDVKVDGTLVRLTPLDFRLLAALVRNRGQILSAAQLLELAWDDPRPVGPERVKFAVMRLRRKLGCHEVKAGPIEAVRGFGYRFRSDNHALAP